MFVWDADEPAFFRGSNTKSGEGVALGAFTGWYMQQMPLALAAFERAGRRPDPVPNPFIQFQARFEEALGPDGGKMYRVQTPDVFVRKATDAALPFLLDTWQPFDVPPYRWQARDRGGREVAAGEWDLSPTIAAIPAGTPAGVYHLSVSGLHPNPQWQWPGTHGAPFMPLAPPEVPEVMVFERDASGTRIPGARGDIQYWFRVPEGVDRFWIAGPRSRRRHLAHNGLRRLTVWDPDGGRAWDATPPDEDVGEDDWVQHRAEISVPPGQDGRLWRVSGSGGLTLDPAIPPVFSVSRTKWFDPETP